jgi:hypothetical protein
MNFSMAGTGLSGQVELSIVRIDSNLDVTYSKQVNITYGCSASAFKSALQNFDGYGPYTISVQRYIYDASGLLLNDTVGAVNIDYVVSFYQLRPSKYVT